MLTNLNNPAILYPARRSRTILVGVLGDTDGLKTAIATNVAAQSYSGAALNGALANPGPATLIVPMFVSVTTSVNAATYNTTDPILVTGTAFDGTVTTVSLTLTAAGGGETITSTLPLATVTTIATPAQLGGGGQFTFGVGNARFLEPPRGVRAGAAGNLVLVDDLSVTDNHPCQLAEVPRVFVHQIGSGSTCFPITVYY